MTAVDYLHVLRRRWKFIAVAAILIAAIAFVTAPEPKHVAPGVSTTGYQATTTLMQDPTATTTVDLSVIQLYIMHGIIPQQAAKTLHYTGNPEQLASGLQITSDPKMPTLNITATDQSRERAIAVANAFADATVNFLQQTQEQRTEATVASLQASLAKLKSQIDDLNNQISGSSQGDSSILSAQRNALLQQYQSIYQRLTQMQTQPAQSSQLAVLQQAVAVPIAASDSTFTAPKSRTTRTGLGLVIGLLLGAAGALIAERFDTRLRGRATVERTFRLPVVAEIPRLRRRTFRRYTLATATAPESASAEAFRTLRSALTLMPSLPLPPLDESATPVSLPRGETSGPPQVIVVTAPSAGVGKTTTAANLTACLAEAGKSVVLFDSDFRHPEAHAFFEIDNRGGLSDVLAAGHPIDIAAIVRPTRVPGVSIVPAGTASWIPTRLVQHVDDIVAQLRGLADVIVIDSPPLLSASEAADLAAQADSVIVVAWDGRTNTEQADRTVDLLSRVGAPALGVALVTNASPAAYASGNGSQRVWPMNLVDHRGSRTGNRSRSSGRGRR